MFKFTLKNSIQAKIIFSVGVAILATVLVTVGIAVLRLGAYALR